MNGSVSKHHGCRALLLCLVILWSPLVMAQDGKSFALVGAQVHTVSGDVIEEGVVVVSEDGKILDVGRADAVTIAEKMERIDVSGKIITPGLIDAHASLGLVEIWAVSELRDTSSGEEGQVHASYQAGESFHEHSAVLAVQRAGGVTDVIVAPSGSVVSGQSAHVQLDGDGLKLGEVQRLGLAQYITLGSKGASMLKGSRGTLVEALRELYEDAAYYVKNEALFDTNRMRELSASPASLRALQEGKTGGQPVVFEASLARDILWALKFAKEQNVRPIILGAEEAWMVLDELAAAEAFVILDAVTNLPDRLESTASRSDNAALCEAAGVPVMLATFSSHNSRRLRQLAGNAVRAGMSQEGALRAVTLEAARGFGLEKTHGSIEKGKRANLVVWSGDPFEFSTRVETMYIEGARVDLESRQDRLFERYRTLQRRQEPAPLERSGEDDASAKQDDSTEDEET